MLPKQALASKITLIYSFFLFFLKVRQFVVKDRSVQNRRIATLMIFVAVSALLTPLSAALTIMRVITTHATKADTFNLFILISFL